MEMVPFQPIGKFIIFLGLLIVLMGILFYFWGKIPFLGKLPGDFVIQRKNFTFYFPLTTIIILNLVLYLLVFLFKK